MPTIEMTDEEIAILRELPVGGCFKAPFPGGVRTPDGAPVPVAFRKTGGSDRHVSAVTVPTGGGVGMAATWWFEQ